VRVGAYYHDLGKSLQPKYFIENLEPGETSPHDKLPPEVSTDAIFAHVTEGIANARKAGLHERIIDFMHMHHGNGVLEYFWAKCREQGNPKNLAVENFRYPGFPPQTRETAILAICDAVEAASRTLKNPDTKSIDALVQRIVYGKLHLGQLDESGLSMADLRRVADSLRETIKHANHGRIEYPWQKAQQDASASPEPLVQTAPRLDSLDRPAKPDAVKPAAKATDDALADTANQTPDLRKKPSAPVIEAPQRTSEELALVATAPVEKLERPSDEAMTRPRRKQTQPDDIGPLAEPPPRASLGDGAIGRRTKRETPSPETKAFVEDARDALAEAAKDLAIAVEPARPEPVAVEPTPGARKRAATLPPTSLRRPPTMPPPGRRSPTIPPGMLPAITPVSPPPTGLPGVAPLDATLPPPSAMRPPALVVQEAPDGVVKIEPASSDASITQPRLERDDIMTRTTQPSIPVPVVEPSEFPPDPTKKQSVEEIEALARRTRATAEVTDDDIEAAIELAPAARRSALGIAKKKPE
jgi:putative nucleotidyltransferase with HDIG domain